MPLLEMPGPLEALLRLAVAFVLSGPIGWEREVHERPAGLRTHVLVCVGSCLLMLVSIVVASDRGTADPGRIAAQVVTGMGFLGAGTIIRYGSTVRGLTTAASLWVTAAIGLTVGIGWYVGAAVVTGGTYLTLTAVRALEGRLVPHHALVRLLVTFRADAFDLGPVVQLLPKLGVEVVRMALEAPAGGERVVRLVVQPPEGMDGGAVARALAEIDAVERAEVA